MESQISRMKSSYVSKKVPPCLIGARKLFRALTLPGGHGHLEQPSGALALLAACAFGWNIKKTWLCASSFHPLSAIAAVCQHPAGIHQSIAGVRDEHGIYLSRRSAAYPPQLAQAFAPKKSVLLSVTTTKFSWDSVSHSFPKKGWQQDRRSFMDGGGLGSMSDWSKPLINKENFFLSIRNHWIPQIIKYSTENSTITL